MALILGKTSKMQRLGVWFGRHTDTPNNNRISTTQRYVYSSYMFIPVVPRRAGVADVHFMPDHSQIMVGSWSILFSIGRNCSRIFGPILEIRTAWHNIWWCWMLTSVAPRVVIDISSVSRMKHERHFSWQTQYFEMLGTLTSFAPRRRALSLLFRFICEEGWMSLLVAGAIFGDVAGWLCCRFHVWGGVSMTAISCGGRNIWWCWGRWRLLLCALSMTIHVWRGVRTNVMSRGRRNIWWHKRLTYKDRAPQAWSLEAMQELSIVCMHLELANAISLSNWRLVKRNVDKSAPSFHLKTWRRTSLLAAFWVASCDLRQGGMAESLSQYESMSLLPKAVGLSLSIMGSYSL